MMSMITRATFWAVISSGSQAERESLHDYHRLNHALAEALDWDVMDRKEYRL